MNIKWIKPNGQEIETNDYLGNIVAAEGLGWVRADEAKKETKEAKPPKKKGK